MPLWKKIDNAQKIAMIQKHLNSRDQSKGDENYLSDSLSNLIDEVEERTLKNVIDGLYISIEQNG